ncbi:autotransporter outer membrane beta-barrel domain-containing protein [Synechococcus sp. AH-551-C10]|nr:autotransporter outer membrane beta-barrel domain-containing protein [Synechococcus sp. AH-551-C10]MDB4659887.1 autotransporter outer membrane beta-barrel domain-containing protein [Synechococcus sp. AH-551-C10]
MLARIARVIPRKEYIIATFACLASINNGAIAQTVTVTSGGNSYTIGSQKTNIFANDKSLAETYPWYGDQALAEALSEAVGTSLILSDTDTSYGPVFFTSLRTSTTNNFVFFSGVSDAILTSYAAGNGYANFYTLAANRYYFATLASSDDGDASYSISGDRYVGKTLSASRDNDDPDGNGSITGYTWQSSRDGSTWSTVGTDSTYTLTGSEEGQYLRLTVAYTDGENFSESVTTSNVQAKDFTAAMAKPFAALKSNNLEIVNSYVKNSLLSSQQSCTTQGVEIFDGKACIHGNYSYASRYTFGDSGNNSFQAHQTAGNYGFDYQVTDNLNIGLRYGRGNSTMDNDTNTTGTSAQASVDTNHWGLKATYEGNKNIFLSGYLGFTDFDVDLDRQSTTNDGTSTSAKSSFDGDAYSAGIKIAKVIPIKSDAVLAPELSATYSTYEQPQIIETGSGDLLTVDRTNSQSLLMRIGGKAVQSLKTNKGRYDASVYLGAWYEFDPYSTRNGEHQVSAQFTESSATAVSSSSQSVQAQKVNLEAGGAVQLSNQFQLTLSGGLDLAADVSNSYVRGGVSWAF